METKLLGGGGSGGGVVSDNPKKYTCLLSQTGTNAPTQIILENTIGVTINISYSGVGIYLFVLSSALPTNKYSLLIGSSYSATNNTGYILVVNDSLFGIETGVTSNIGGATITSDDILNNTLVEILQYD